MKKVLVYILFYVYSVTCNYRLDVVHYNDFHDRFEETSIDYPVCMTNDSRCIGGFARLYYEINALMKQKPDAVLLNAGDNYQGTYWYTILKWNVTQYFLNMLPNDAYALGNHEFDDGVPGLVPFMKSLTAPIVAANIDTSQEPTMEGLYEPYVIIKRNDRRIGIIGLVTTETMTTSSSGKVIIKDPKPAVKKVAKELTKKGVDIIIVLSHCGLDIDREIAEDYAEDIDLIVGGHTHSLLYNGGSPSSEPISGPYPIVVRPKNNSKRKVLIVTASAFSKYVGNLTVWFDDNGEVLGFDGTPVFLNRSIPEDKHIKGLLQPFADKLHKLTAEVIGDATDNLDHDKCSSQECEIGNIIAEGLLETLSEKRPSNYTAVSFLLRNNIRGSIPEGPITRGAVITTLPFSNRVARFLLEGKHLKDMFEFCLSNYWEEKPFAGPWVPQVGNMRLTVNTSEPIGSRVISLLVKENDVYKPMDMEETYAVASYDFIAIGKNRFPIIENNARELEELEVAWMSLEQYITRHSPISDTLDGRLEIIQ